MAPSVEAANWTAAALGYPGSPITVGLTLGATGQRYILVEIGQQNATIANITGVTIGGVSLARLSGTLTVAGNTQGEIWGGLVSLTGAQTVTVSYTNPNFQMMVGARSIIGMDTTTPYSGVTTASGISYGSGASVAVPTTSGDLTISFLATDGNATGSLTATGSVDWSDIGNGRFGGDHHASAGTSFTHTWLSTGGGWNDWALVGLNIKAAGTGGGGATNGTDDFNRANGGLGSGWTQQWTVADFAIVSNRARASVAGYSADQFTLITPGNSQYARVQIPTFGATSTIGVFVCGAAPGTRQYYRGFITGSTGSAIEQRPLGTTLGSETATAWSPGDGIELVRNGNSLALNRYVGNTGAPIQLLSVPSDTSLVGGGIGIICFINGSEIVEVDNFAGGTYTPTAGLMAQAMASYGRRRRM